MRTIIIEITYPDQQKTKITEEVIEMVLTQFFRVDKRKTLPQFNVKIIKETCY